MSLEKALFAACAAIGLAACHSAPTRIFTLYPREPHAAVVVYHGAPVRIDAVHVPPALDRVEVVTPLGAGELKIHDTDHWSAPLAQIVRQTLILDLVGRLPPQSVIAPHLVKPDGALGISVDLVDFGEDATGSRLTVSWTVTTDMQSPLPGQGIVILKTVGGSAGAAATARNLSELLGQLADRIAADLSSAQR